MKFPLEDFINSPERRMKKITEDLQDGIKETRRRRAINNATDQALISIRKRGPITPDLDARRIFELVELSIDVLNETERRGI